MEKGEFGYIDWRKKKDLKHAIIIFLLGFSVFFLGLFLNKFSKKNIFTVFSVLFFLPAARYLVTYIILYKHKTYDKASYIKLKETLDEGDLLLCDIAMSTADRTIGFYFLVVIGDVIIGFPFKSHTVYLDEYIKPMLTSRGFKFRLEIHEDFALFMNRVNKEKEKVRKNKEKNISIPSLDLEEIGEIIKSLAI